MSIGPAQQEDFGVKGVGRVNYALKRGIKKYFNDPIHYIFYTFLLAMMIGLFFGMDFSWKFYAILIFFGFLELFNSFNEHE